MRQIKEIVADIQEYRLKCVNDSIGQLPDNRLKLSYYISELGDQIADLERQVSAAKNNQHIAYFEHRKTLSAADSDKQSRIDTFEELWKAEYAYSKAKQIIMDSKEILNAVSTKLRWAEREFSIQE